MPKSSERGPLSPRIRYLLGIYGALLLIVLVQGWRQIAASTPRRTRVCWVAAFAVVAGFILAVVWRFDSGSWEDISFPRCPRSCSCWERE